MARTEEDPLGSMAELKIEGEGEGEGEGAQVSCFSEVVDDVTFLFQFIRLPKQIYVWLGCNSSRFGHLYAAASTRPSNAVSVTSLLGGTSDNTGSGIARRLVLKTGLNIILACNIPKNSPMLEANAEKVLIKKLIDLGYTKSAPLRCNLLSVPYKLDWRLSMIMSIVLLTNFLCTSLPMAGFSDQDEIIRSVSDAPPTHYTVKVESFSLLAKHAIEKYETGSFEAGGYKWKLVLYPNGNKSKNVKEHVSIYLALADSGSLRPGWEVCAVFRLYLLDQNKDNYLILQGGERRFHGLKREWGFDRFIPSGTFKDASQGFLLEDSCVFGADVFVSKERMSGRGECLSMIKDASSSKHVWKIENVSKLDKDCYFSNSFFAGDTKWKIQFYPKGNRHGTGTHVSVYLVLAEPEMLPVGTKLLTEFTVRMFDQLQGRHIAGKVTKWFGGEERMKENGWVKYVSMAYFTQPNSGLLLRDVCLLEADVCVHATVDPL